MVEINWSCSSTTSWIWWKWSGAFNLSHGAIFTEY